MAAKDGVLVRRRLRIFAAAAALVLLCAVCVGGVSGADVWDGTANTSWYKDNQDTFTITTAEQLAGLSKLVHDRGSTVTDFAEKTIYLGDDIDLSGHSWVSIGYILGSGLFQNYPFKGTFDGQGYTISNIKQENIGYNEPGGLFGYVNGGTVTNVTLQNVEINVQASPVFVGSLVGVLKDGTVTDCNISGNNKIQPLEVNSFGQSPYVVTVDDVIGEIRGTNEFIYGITATKIDTSQDEFNHFNVPVNYKNSANHQDRGLRYEVTIPAQLPIGEDGVGSASLSVSSLRIPSSTVVKVYVHGDFLLEHQTVAEATVAYELRNGASELLADGALVGQFTMSSQSPLPLTATVNGTVPYAGTYTDLLTFEYWVEEAA